MGTEEIALTSYFYIDEIEERIQALDNKYRHSEHDKAVELIKVAVTEKCLCEYAFYSKRYDWVDDMEEIGFIIRERNRDDLDYREGRVECPYCHQNYVLKGKHNGHSHIMKVFKV